MTTIKGDTDNLIVWVGDVKASLDNGNFCWLFPLRKDEEYYIRTSRSLSGGDILSLLTDDEFRRCRETFEKVFIESSFDEKIWPFLRSHGCEGYYSPHRILKAHVSRDMLNQLAEDGLEHLTPVVLDFGLPPHQLKSRLGRSLWRKISHCSGDRLSSYFGDCFIIQRKPHLYSHTKGEQQYVDASTTELGKRTQHYAQNVFVYNYTEFVKRMLSIERSDVVRKDLFLFPVHEELSYQFAIQVRVLEMMTEVREFFKGHENDFDGVSMFVNAEQMIVDTQRMAIQLEEPFNIEWSWRRFMREHERLVRETNKGMLDELSDEKILEDDERTFDGVTFTLLTSERQIGQEGIEMEHCVRSYRERVRAGDYLVYSVRWPDGYRATLGVKVLRGKHGNADFRIYDQCVGPRNEKLPDDKLSVAMKFLPRPKMVT